MPSERRRLRDIRNTSSFRLTLLLGLVALVGVIALTTPIYTLSAKELNARSDRILWAAAARLTGMPPRVLQGEVRLATARNASGCTYYGCSIPRGVA